MRESYDFGSGIRDGMGEVSRGRFANSRCWFGVVEIECTTNHCSRGAGASYYCHVNVCFGIRIVRYPIRRSRVPASSAAGVATDVQKTTFGVRAGPRDGWHCLSWREGEFVWIGVRLKEGRG